MTIVANTFLTYSEIGAREDLSNLIALISPVDTPVLSNAKKGTVDNQKYEWQRDALATAASNAQLQGDDVTAFDTVTPTVRVSNRTQISRKTIIIADSINVLDLAGRDRELSYQIAKRAKELKRDQEFGLLANNAAVTGSSAVAPQYGALLAMVGSIDGTNVSKGGGAGANPTDAVNFTVARVDGTTRPFVEQLLKDVVRLTFVNGGSPDTLMVDSIQKSVVSNFAGISTKTYSQGERKPAAVIGSADLYVSEFGNISVIPNRFQRARDAWLLDFDAIRVVTARPYKVVELAKTGDAEKRMLILEYGLKIDHEQMLALVTDLA